MKKPLLCISLPLMIAGVVFGQVNLPPCTPVSGPACTDYFGVANWANSPLPAGTITGFTVKASGSGYATPIFTLTDVNSAPTALTVAFTQDTSGGIATVTGTLAGSFIAPQITVTDMGPGWVSGSATCGTAPLPACGSGAVVLANIGAPLTAGTGVRKFQDALTLPAANLQIPVPDTTTFPGADYYVIGLKEYTAKMHVDLPPTRLRGYCQMNAPGAAGVCTPSYLGPTIVAQKNRPVRVLFMNLLPTGAGGNLFIPTDTTYMGAGPPYTQNRATLHLHGGATPWISDGTPHQWTAPAGETGPARGASAQLVPDMWFDPTSHALIASCAGQSTCATPGATIDPGPGNLTFFWTNQQGGRLMFYHDHAYGITRLNVYAGEAAGYLLVDPTEEALLAAATVPGTITNPATLTGDLAHLVPLVIQDKTFVPTASEVAFEDPTWLNGFGTTPGFANPGDLWFPHVYTTNQNPADPGGANAFGRWDYGPWTLPGNQTALLAASPQDAVTFACTSTAFPNQAINCPIIPNPSGTPEGFMDTPVVNGKAYPVLHVAPEAYRFRILSVGNDRSFNLQWYVADPTVTTLDGRKNTEVKMVPAIQPSGAVGTLPLCTQLTPITNTTLFMGLATSLLDSTGNPLNGTGLPAGCWPNFGAGSQTAGIPIQQTMWPADGRAGGVPDPTTAGPAWIEIGTEGGLLPAPVAIPSMPVGYEANTRSVTITNVSVHGLWLGPAERADVIVDFSQVPAKCAALGVSPCTLILYNDAPTPAPAVDSRLDYFTGDGDQSPIGGAPNTLAGFGPNTRTIMQVIVDQPKTSTTPFSLATLNNALPGIFAQTQPQIIVPEPTYPPASGGYSPILTYSLISDATLTYFPPGSTTPVTKTDERKTIQELFTLDYGRMNATLGVELPLTNFLTQTTIPLGYIDPPTETVQQGDTQLWHITHNGVDTHFVHFHLFNVQVINRSGWDGTVRPPDQNELGWKETVRMNPLEDILVALQPITPVLPFPIRDSYRLLDVTMPVGSDCAAPTTGQPSPLPCSIMTDVNPANNNPLNTPNKLQNFGWEYVWHCHILGHEENDMMRAIQFKVPPEAPTSLAVASAAPATGLNLTWTDNSASETGFTLQRDVTAAFSTPTNVAVLAVNPDANGQGITWGSTITYNDTAATGPGPYYYRVQAYKPDASYWAPGPDITSTWSNVVSFGAAASVSPMSLAFGTVALSTPSAAQTTTLSNASTTTAFTYTLAITGANAADFAVTSDTCAGNVAASSNCSIGVTFTPTLTVLESANLVITTTAPGNPAFTVALTGTGSGLPTLTITANNTTMKYGSKTLPTLTFSYNPPNPAGVTTAPTCTTTATAWTTTPGSAVGTYPITCTGAANAGYTITYVAGTLTVTQVPLMIWGPNASMLYGATVPAITPAYTGLVNGDTAATLAIAPNVAPTCTAYVTPPSAPANSNPPPGTLVTSTTQPGAYATVCSGAADLNYIISYTNGVFTVNKAALTITPAPLTLPYNTTIPSTFTLNATGLVGTDTLTSLGMTQPPITCTTTASTVTPQPPVVGSYTITCTGPAQAPPPPALGQYTVTYATGTLTVSIATPSVTFTGAPPSAQYNSPFTVTATTNALGAVAPTITGTAGVCTVGPVTGTSPATATVTMNSGTGTCTLTANWAAIPPNYTAASATQATAAAKIAPTVTFIGAPAPSANYNSSFGVTATTNASTMPTISGTTGVCTVGPVSGTPASATATVTMISGTGTCGLTANWAADANYSLATATQSTAAAKIAPTVTFGPAPTSAVYNTSFAVAAWTNASTMPIVAGTAGVCTVGAVTGTPATGSANVTMTSGTGTCTLTANWAADANYLGAGPVTQTTTAAKAPSTTTIVSNLPNPSIVGQVVTVTFSVTGTTPPTGTVTVSGGGRSCTATLPASSCTLSFPTSAIVTLTASYSGDLNFLASASASATQIVSQVSLSAASLLFGNQLVGTTSASQYVSISNVGTTPLGIISIVYNGPFRDSTNCPVGGALNPGSSCRFSVRFSPTAPGVANGSVVITTSDVASPATIPLSGTGVLPPLNLMPVAWNFGGVTSGTASAPQTFVLTNGTAAPVTVSRVQLNGLNPGQFVIQSTNCITTLPVGGTCTINVAFRPTAPGTYSATLTIRDNLQGNPPSSALSGTGL